MSLPDFKDEIEFRDKFIGPLLQKLGYVLVTHTHGANEHGKDFIFADFDKFEHIRYYAVQAKVGDIGTGTAALDKLLSQVKQCFTVKIRGYKGADEQRVSSVYILASGKISDQARTYITESCHNEHYGENVYFVDGDRLERLDQFQSYQDDQQRKAILAGIAVEAVTNMRFIPFIKDSLARQQVIIARCRCEAMNQALIKPTPDTEFYLSVYQTLSCIEELNQLCNVFTMAALVNAPIDHKTRKIAIDLCDTALENNKLLADTAQKMGMDLQAQYKLNIEIVSDDSSGNNPTSQTL